MLAAFDLETARWSDPVDPKAGLGVCCVAIAEESRAWVYWSSQDFICMCGLEDDMQWWLAQHPPDRCWGKRSLNHLVGGWYANQSRYSPPVGWNSLSFDWQVLAVESGMYAECKELALNHIDLMFAFLSKQGHRLSLASAAEGIGLKKGVAGLDNGARACDLWQAGEYETVLRYCAQDAIITLELAKHALNGGFAWRTKAGNEKRFTIKTNSPDDLLVSNVMKWPALSNPLVDPRDSWRWLND